MLIAEHKKVRSAFLALDGYTHFSKFLSLMTNPLTEVQYIKEMFVTY
jgi:hypothetical protein